MTFTEIVSDICGRLNLTSTEAQTRVGKEVNKLYKQVTTSMGITQPNRRVAGESANTSIGSALVTFDDMEKITRVYDDSSGSIRVLDEKTWDQIREKTAGTSDPTQWALETQDADSVIIRLNVTMQEVLALKADGYSTTTTLSGSQEPAFPESFHDILVEGVLAKEYKKKEKLALAKDAKQEFEDRSSDLRMWHAKTLRKKTRQGENSQRVSPSSIGGGGGGGGGSTPDGSSSYTQTGLITFERAPSAPFAVEAGSAKVTNLDADLLDGLSAADIIAAGGGVAGPVSSVDNEIVRFNGTGGATIQGGGITIADGASGTLAGTNSGDVTLAGALTYLTIVGQVITRAAINLATHITGRLPFANLVAATAEKKIIGRRSGSAGDFEELTLDASLDISGTTLGVATAVANQTANTVYAGPTSGGAAPPTFRALTVADLPSTVQVLDRDVTVSDVNTTTTETTVYSYSLPAGTLGTTKALRLTLSGDFLNNSGGNSDLTIRFKIGGATYFTGVHTTSSNANRGGQALDVFVSAENSASAQRGHCRWVSGEGSAGNATGSLLLADSTNRHYFASNNTFNENTALAKTIEVTVQHSQSHANISFRAHWTILELLN